MTAATQPGTSKPQTGRMTLEQYLDCVTQSKSLAALRHAIELYTTTPPYSDDTRKDVEAFTAAVVAREWELLFNGGQAQ